MTFPIGSGVLATGTKSIGRAWLLPMSSSRALLVYMQYQEWFCQVLSRAPDSNLTVSTAEQKVWTHPNDNSSFPAGADTMARIGPDTYAIATRYSGEPDPATALVVFKVSDTGVPTVTDVRTFPSLKGVVAESTNGTTFNLSAAITIQGDAVASGKALVIRTAPEAEGYRVVQTVSSDAAGLAVLGPAYSADAIQRTTTTSMQERYEGLTDSYEMREYITNRIVLWSVTGYGVGPNYTITQRKQNSIIEESHFFDSTNRSWRSIAGSGETEFQIRSTVTGAVAGTTPSIAGEMPGYLLDDGQSLMVGDKAYLRFQEAASSSYGSRIAEVEVAPGALTIARYYQLPNNQTTGRQHPRAADPHGNVTVMSTGLGPSFYAANAYFAADIFGTPDLVTYWSMSGMEGRPRGQWDGIVANETDWFAMGHVFSKVFVSRVMAPVNNTPPLPPPEPEPEPEITVVDDGVRRIFA